METGEEQPKKEIKGFAGLSSLVSEVDTSLPTPAKQEVAGSGASSSTERPTTSGRSQLEPQPNQQQSYQAPAQPFSSFSAVKWLLGIAAVIGVVWLIGEAYKSPSYSVSAYSPPEQNTAPKYSTAPAQTQVPSLPEETKPPVGQNLVFSMTQIRYCLAEDIRLDGARSALNYNSDSDVDRFNAMVADYNSRCGNFSYESGALESVRQDLVPYWTQLQVEGESRFAYSSSPDSLSEPTPMRIAPNTTVQEFQQDSGPPDGALGADVPAALSTAGTANSTSTLSRPSRIESSSKNTASPTLSAPVALPSQNIQSSSATNEGKNFSLCISGQYPSLCNHKLLTLDESIQVAAAEKRVNFQRCISEQYPFMCKHSLLTSEEAVQVVAEAERRRKSK